MRTTRYLLLTAALALPMLAQSAPAKPKMADPTDLAALGVNPVVEQPVSGWQYSVKRDEMRETTVSTAILPAASPLNLAFPYQGATGMLAIHGANGVAMAMVGADSGILDCDEACTILIKFDDKKAEEWRVFVYGGPGNLASISDPDKFIAKLKTASRVAIELPFYDNGAVVIKFSVVGLTWPPPPATATGGQ